VVAAVAFALVLVAPHVGFVFEPERSWMNQWLVTVAEHPECTTVDRRTVEGSATHHGCVVRAAWRTDAMPLVDGVSEAWDHDAAWYGATVVLLLLAGGGALVGASRSSDPAAQETQPAP
jgi:hypothetical protein